MNATLRIAQAIRILRSVTTDIEQRWPSYSDRPAEAIECETSIECNLVDLERCAREDAPALDKLVARTTAVTCSEK